VCGLNESWFAGARSRNSVAIVASGAGESQCGFAFWRFLVAAQGDGFTSFLVHIVGEEKLAELL
jgi:hypothetical protein